VGPMKLGGILESRGRNYKVNASGAQTANGTSRLISLYESLKCSVPTSGYGACIGCGEGLFPMRGSVSPEPSSVWGRAQRAAGPSLLKRSRRLIEESQQLLQAAGLLLEGCDRIKQPVPARLKRAGA